MSEPSDPAEPYALVVVDDGLIRRDAMYILEDAGFRTFEASDGDKAMEPLDREHAVIVLLFTDVQMPGSRDGFAVARETAARWPHVAIVVASGHLRPGPGDMPEGALLHRQAFHGRHSPRPPSGHSARRAQANPFVPTGTGGGGHASAGDAGELMYHDMLMSCPPRGGPLLRSE